MKILQSLVSSVLDSIRHLWSETKSLFSLVLMTRTVKDTAGLQRGNLRVLNYILIIEIKVVFLFSFSGNAYEITEAEDVSPGTKIVISLKPECRNYAEEGAVKEIIKKHSSFVGFPVHLNGKLINTMQVLYCFLFSLFKYFSIRVIIKYLRVSLILLLIY